MTSPTDAGVSRGGRFRPRVSALITATFAVVVTSAILATALVVGRRYANDRVESLRGFLERKAEQFALALGQSLGARRRPRKLHAKSVLEFARPRPDARDMAHGRDRGAARQWLGLPGRSVDSQDRGGRQNAADAIRRDVTERRALPRSVRYATAVDVVYAPELLRLVQANAAAQAKDGWTREAFRVMSLA